jgi:hypothetical protein
LIGEDVLKFLALGLAMALLAGAANAAPLILRCDGVNSAVSLNEAPSQANSFRYYWIANQQFGRLRPLDNFWHGNICTTAGAACATDDQSYSAAWTDGPAAVTVQINRKTGRVRETNELSTSRITFVGDCAPSADPAQTGAPNKF